MGTRVRVASSALPMGDIPDNYPEIKRVLTAGTIITEDPIVDVNRLIEYHSDWYRLKVSVAVFLRIKATLQKRVQDRRKSEEATNTKSLPLQHEPNIKHSPTATKDEDGHRGPLSVQDLEDAQAAILRFVQSQAFSKELEALYRISSEDYGDQRSRVKQKKTEIRKGSCLHRLDPFVHQGVLCVGGRLSQADLPAHTKHPVILPRKSHVTTLIIRNVHQRLGHAGRGHTLAKFREKYWILSANSTVCYQIGKCVTCRRNRAPVAEQKMADLPKDRVTPAPPFMYTGVDYFGPYLIKEGRRELKRYGCLFTCMASRAIHIEAANSLDTDSFLQALTKGILLPTAAQSGRFDVIMEQISSLPTKNCSKQLTKWTTIKSETSCAKRMWTGHLTHQLPAIWVVFGNGRFVPPVKFSPSYYMKMVPV